MKLVLMLALVALLAFMAGWVANEWAEQEMDEEQSHMTVIPPPVQQVP